MRPYDRNYDPPAPVIKNVVISKPYSNMSSEPLKGLVDSGGDGTAIPQRVIDNLRLIPVRERPVAGYKGKPSKELTFLVDISLDGFKFELIEVVSCGDEEEILIGRNLLNDLKVLLDGKNLNFEIIDP